MIMSFTESVHRYKLKKEATLILKNFQNHSSIGLDNVGMNLTEGPISSDVGIVILHPSKGTH